jgi:hypothetical protein
VSGAAGGQWQRGNRQQDDEQDGKGAFLEERDQAAERVLPVCREPGLELVRDRDRGFVRELGVDR